MMTDQIILEVTEEVIFFKIIQWLNTSSAPLGLIDTHLHRKPQNLEELKESLFKKKKTIISTPEKTASQRCNDIQICKTLIEISLSNPQETFCSIVLRYLLSQKTVNQQKIVALFPFLVQKDHENADHFYHTEITKRKSLFPVLPLVKNILIAHRIEKVKETISTLAETLKAEKTPLALSSLFYEKFIEIEEIAAFILYLLEQKTLPQAIIESRFFYHFIVTYITFIDATDSTIKLFYEILSQFEIAAPFIALAKKTPLKIQNYDQPLSFYGEKYLIPTAIAAFSPITKEDTDFLFTLTEENFCNLHHFFGPTFLSYVLRLVSKKNQEINQLENLLIQKMDTLPLEQLSFFINEIVVQSPRLLKKLSDAFSGKQIDALMRDKNGAFFHLLSIDDKRDYIDYRAATLGLCVGRFANYLTTALSKEHTTFDNKCRQAINLLSWLELKCNFIAIEEIYPPLLDFILSYAHIFKETLFGKILIRLLRHYADTQSSLHSIALEKEKKLFETLNVYICENINAILNLNDSKIIQLYHKLQLESEILSLIQKPTYIYPSDKYTLYAHIIAIALNDSENHTLIEKFLSNQSSLHKEISAPHSRAKSEDITVFECICIQILAKISHEEMIKKVMMFLIEHVKGTSRENKWFEYSYDGKSILKLAVAQDNKILVETFFKNYPNILFKQHEELVEIAATVGHKKTTQYLLYIKNKDKTPFLLTQKALKNTTISGHLWMIKKLLSEEKEFSEEDLSYLIQDILYTASIYGKLDVIQYCFSDKKNYLTDTSIDKAFIYAASAGHLSIIEYLMKICALQEKVFFDALYESINYNRAAIAKHLIKSLNEESYCLAFHEACLHSNTQVINYFLYLEEVKKRPNQKDIDTALRALYSAAITPENLDNLKYLCAIEEDNKPSQEAIKSIILGQIQKTIMTQNDLSLIEALLSMRRDDELSLALYDAQFIEDLKILSPFLKKGTVETHKLNTLLGIKKAILDLEEYGLSLSEKFPHEAKTTLNAAEQLKKTVYPLFFFELNHIFAPSPKGLSQKKINELHQSLHKTLRSSQKLMGKHRSIWIPALKILAHIMIALTGIGLPLLAIQWHQTGHGFFSSSGKTKRQKMICQIGGMADTLIKC